MQAQRLFNEIKDLWFFKKCHCKESEWWKKQCRFPCHQKFVQISLELLKTSAASGRLWVTSHQLSCAYLYTATVYTYGTIYSTYMYIDCIYMHIWSLGELVQTPVKIMWHWNTWNKCSFNPFIYIHLHECTLMGSIVAWTYPSAFNQGYYNSDGDVWLQFRSEAPQSHYLDTVDIGVATIRTGSVPFNTVFLAKKPMLLLHSAALHTAYALSCRSPCIRIEVLLHHEGTVTKVRPLRVKGAANEAVQIDIPSTRTEHHGAGKSPHCRVSDCRINYRYTIFFASMILPLLKQAPASF